MGTGWVWDGFHPREEKLNGAQDPWLCELSTRVAQECLRSDGEEGSRCFCQGVPRGGTARTPRVGTAQISRNGAETTSFAASVSVV